MTLFWLDFLKDVVPNHLLSTDMSALPPEFEGRSMWVKKAQMFDVECVARGYLSGSAGRITKPPARSAASHYQPAWSKAMRYRSHLHPGNESPKRPR